MVVFYFFGKINIDVCTKNCEFVVISSNFYFQAKLPCIQMSHAYYQVWLHAIFTTKDRKPLITPDIEEELFPLLHEEFKEMGGMLKIVNGLSDHIHCLFLLDAQHSYAAVMKQIKGASSHYINQQHLINEKFSWQKGYAVFSVSESDVDKIYHYIKNQKIKRESLEEEGVPL
jgi:REP element-mobilizing transposase RayT